MSGGPCGVGIRGSNNVGCGCIGLGLSWLSSAKLILVMEEMMESHFSKQ